MIVSENYRRSVLFLYATTPLTAIKGGPIPSSEILKWENRTQLLDANYHKFENGWSTLEDGSRYVAVKTFFPNGTAEMIDWWFEWAQEKENIRYKIWCPGAHYAMAQMETPDYQFSKEGKGYWGKSRFPVEDVGLGVAQIRLDFVPPSEFGFETLPDSSTMLAVRVGLPNGLLKHTDMIHYIRPVAGGVEMRSRFWMARDLEAMSGGVGIMPMKMAFLNWIWKNLIKKEKKHKEGLWSC